MERNWGDGVSQPVVSERHRRTHPFANLLLAAPSCRRVFARRWPLPRSQALWCWKVRVERRSASSCRDDRRRQRTDVSSRRHQAEGKWHPSALRWRESRSCFHWQTIRQYSGLWVFSLENKKLYEISLVLYLHFRWNLSYNENQVLTALLWLSRQTKAVQLCSSIIRFFLSWLYTMAHMLISCNKYVSNLMGVFLIDMNGL